MKINSFNEYLADPEGFEADLLSQIEEVEEELEAWRAEERAADDLAQEWAGHHIEQLEEQLRELRGDLPENVLWHIERRFPGSSDTVRDRLLKKAMKVRLEGGSLERFLA